MDLQVFNQNGWEIRTIEKSGEIWFVAKDVCECLEIKDTSSAVLSLSIDEKLIQTIMVSGQNRDIWTVSESGLYLLIFKSRKSEAKKFQKWVTSEVLPSIRKTGIYATDITIEKMIDDPDFAIELLQKLKFERQEKALFLQQRDEAIRTKAHIGNKREATSMATASVAVKRANKLEDELGRGKTYRTAKSISWIKDYFSTSRGLWSQLGKKLTQLSNELGYEVKKIDNEDFGTVNSYHIEVIRTLQGRINNDENMLGKYRF